MRMRGCKDPSKHIWTCGYEDVRIQRFKETLKNGRVWGCENGRIQARAHEPVYMSMQGCMERHMNLRTWGCKDARIQASTHEHKDTRMRGCKDTSKCTGT